MDKANVKILLVDDEEKIREIYSEELEEYAYFVITAENGLDALDKLQDIKDVDILITDLKMPRMTGLQLLEEVYLKHPQLMTMIITGNRDHESMSKAIELGVHDFLDKPLKMKLFEHKIKKAILQIEGKRKRDEILKYLLQTLTNQSMDDFYKMNALEQNKILTAVQGLISTKIAKGKIA